MSILIKMEMPKSCADCPLFESKYHFHGCHAVPKSFNDMDMWNFVGDRPTWCPLIEVPKHGDLIDRERLIDIAAHLMNIAKNDDIANGVKWLWQYIIEAPAIIESEE